MQNIKRTIVHHKIAIGVGSALLLTMGTAHASNVKGFGQSDLQNDGQITDSQVNGVDSLSFRLPAGNTQVTLSGYVRGDLRFDDSSDLGDSFVVSSIPADGSAGDQADGHFRLHGRQSRFRISSATELEGGKSLSTQLEGDFFGGGGNESLSNSTGFRLRHAVATYDAWTIGQTWTNFMDFVAYPTTVDFFGPAGKSFVRQGQIRYTLDNGLSFSIENAESDGFAEELVEQEDGTFDVELARLRESTGGTGSDILPDITAAWRGGPGGAGGSYEIAAIVRFLGVDGELNGVQVNEDATGFGFNVAGGWSFGPVSVAASLTGGDGIGRYIINGFGNDVYVDLDGELETVTAASFSANVKYDWTENSSSLIAIGAFSNDDPSQSNGIDSLGTLHINYIWSPYPSSSFGVELIQGTIDNADGSSGDATRLAFGAQLNF